MSPDHAGAGFPRRCEIRPGTAREPGWLEDALARLEAVCGGTAPTHTVVMDAGIASAENILWLGERGYHWIALGLKWTRFEAALERLHSGLPVKGRLKQRFPAVARPYEITLETADTGADGLRTSHVDWDIETVLRTDRRLTDIEAPFRSLKSELDLRPICHQRDHRIAAHLRLAARGIGPRRSCGAGCGSPRAGARPTPR